MLKNNRNTLIVTSIITLLPIALGIVFWNKLPAEMATHFGIDNEANGFMPKPLAVFALPLFLLAILWLGAIVTSRDPRKQNISPKLFTLVLWIAPVISIFVAAGIYPYNLGKTIDISFISELFIGILFIVIGNYLPKARQNYTIGIRVPWTLASEDNWNRTHRMAGPLWIAGGILMVIIALTGSVNLGLLMVIPLVLAIVPIIYSYMIRGK